ncbi:MAG TPA: 23S rRNA (pseudouridine(1915)-N(3))-methyltransferase RlmH [Sphingomonadales bacterium]
MDLSIIAVGRLKSGPEAALVAEYLKRLPWNVAIHEVEERRPITGPERQSREADLILAAIPAQAEVIALDERGKSMASADFAAFLGVRRDAGRHLAFVIGGADGLHQRVRDRASRLLSFGPMTWPHAFARVMLVEQLYRAHAILAGHPYHK